MTEQPDGRIHLALDVSNDWALRSWLLGFGAGVRVLAPPDLAATMASELARALARYRDAPVLPAESGMPRGRGA
jgi:predicted DNA-binding transcriptional regulator YafY